MAAFILSIPWQFVAGALALVWCLLAGVAIEAFANAPRRDDLPNQGN